MHVCCYFPPKSVCVFFLFRLSGLVFPLVVVGWKILCVQGGGQVRYGLNKTCVRILVSVCLHILTPSVSYADDDDDVEGWRWNLGHEYFRTLSETNFLGLSEDENETGNKLVMFRCRGVGAL